MAVEVLVLSKGARVFREAGRKQVREQARHDCWTQHIIQSLKALFHKERINVEEEVVNVLHSERKVFETQFEGEIDRWIE